MLPALGHCWQWALSFRLPCSSLPLHEVRSVTVSRLTDWTYLLYMSFERFVADNSEWQLTAVGALAVQGLAMQRFLQAMAAHDGPDAADFEFVLVAGHFLMRDENLFTFFEGHSLQPPDHPHSKPQHQRSLSCAVLFPWDICVMHICMLGVP